jgi:ribosomal protein S17
MGDKVVIEECRPLSATKTWKVAKVAERARPE